MLSGTIKRAELTHVNHLLLQHWPRTGDAAGAKGQPGHGAAGRGPGERRAELGPRPAQGRGSRLRSAALGARQSPVCRRELTHRDTSVGSTSCREHQNTR